MILKPQVLLALLLLTGCGGGGSDGGGTVTPDPTPAATDTDGDGVADTADAFPNDATETLDTDGDGVGDNADAFPSDAAETLDADADGVGDNADVFPNDAAETADTDGDGVGDNADAFPSDATETLDTDADGVGDNTDVFPSDAIESMDSDDDGVGDNADAFPSDAAETLDSDSDGLGDNADLFPNDATETVDADGDGVGDNADAFPNDDSESADTDGDGIGDNADTTPMVSDDTSRYTKPTTYTALATSISDLTTKVSAAEAGDVIALANGTYTDVDIKLSKDGVIVVAETSGEVSIEGRSTIELSGDNMIFEGFTFENGQPEDSDGAIIISGNYTRVTNCKIDHFNDDEPDNGYKWLSIDDEATHAEVDHCTFTGKETEGALLVVWRDSEAAQYHHIYRNIFSDHQYVAEEDIGDDNNAWEAIRIGTSTYSQSSSHSVVESNYFYDCNGEIEIISNKSGHNIYRHNTFESSAGMLTLRHGVNCTVDSNYFLIDDSNGGGIRAIDSGHIITNNYIEGAKSGSNSRGGICLSSSTTDPSLSGYWEVSDVTVSNNTIINSRQSLHYGSSAKDNAPASATISNNLIRNNIASDGDYDFVRVTENGSSEALNIIDPTYANNYFYGSASLGFSPTPAGISLTELALTKNSGGQYIVTDSSLNVGAPELEKLDFESDVGCNF